MRLAGNGPPGLCGRPHQVRRLIAGQQFARHLGDLDAAQRVFWFTQMRTGRPGARRMRPSALDRLLRRQQTQPETGDTVARSIQAMFSGDWYQEDDVRAFLQGLATRQEAGSVHRHRLVRRRCGL